MCATGKGVGQVNAEYRKARGFLVKPKVSFFPSKREEHRGLKRHLKASLRLMRLMS